MCIWLTHTRMPSILCLVKLSQVESEVVNSSVALADRFFFGLLTFNDIYGWTWPELYASSKASAYEILRACCSFGRWVSQISLTFSDHSDHWRSSFSRQAKPAHAANFGDVPQKECCRRSGWTCSFWLHTVPSDYSFLESTKETNDGPPPSAVGFSFMPDLRLWVA
jgi:hypothetical protein